MRAAYNQDNVALYPLDEICEDPCDNCMFLKPEDYTCILFDFGEESFYNLPGCWNGIFIPEPLNNIFEL
jgi:hypothetical protein